MKKDEKTGRFVKTWTEEEEKFIIENSDIYSIDYIVYVLNKPYEAVVAKRKRLGVKVKRACIWSNEEFEYMVKNMDLKSEYEMMIDLKTKTVREIRGYKKEAKKKLRAIEREKKNALNPTKTKKENSPKKVFHWDDEKDEILKQYHGKIPNGEIAEMLGCNKAHVSRRVSTLGIVKIKRWEEREINYLRENYKDLTLEELAKTLNRSVSAIKSKLTDMGLKGTWWEKSEDDFLKSNYTTMTMKEMGEHLNRSRNGVSHRMSKLGLHTNIIEYNGENFDSNQELEVYKFIKDNFFDDIKRNTKTFLNDKVGERYRPDFVVEKECLIIEYYGMYISDTFHRRFENYIEKTHRKNEYFNSLEGYYFIGLYPEDLKDNFEGVRNKLASFCYAKN